MIAEEHLIQTIISNIKECNDTKTKFSDKNIIYNSRNTTLWNLCANTMKNKIVKLNDARTIVNELLPIAPDIISYSLNINENEKDSWQFFNKALETTSTLIEIQNTSKHTYKGRKIQKFWSRYALKKLEDINSLITEQELQEHFITILPYTNVSSKNIKLLYGKDILIMFRLMLQKYPHIKCFNQTMCFRFNDTDISMKSLETIKNEDIDAYNYIITTFQL